MTERQKAILAFIDRFRAEHCAGPSYGQIEEALGMGRGNVQGALYRLRVLGLVTWDEGVRGSLRTVNAPAVAAGGGAGAPKRRRK